MTDADRCSICGAHVREQAVTYTQDVCGHLAVVTDVPALVCVQCGEQYFLPGTVDRLQQLIGADASSDRAHRTMQVPVFSFAGTEPVPEVTAG